MKFTVKNVRLLRSSMLISVLLIFILTGQSRFFIEVLIMTIIYAGLTVFLVFCSISGQEHIVNAPALVLPEMLLSSGFLLFINPYWLLPIVCIQAAELVILKQKLFIIRSFIVLVPVMTFAGFLIKDDLNSAVYSIPVLLPCLS